MIAVYLRSFFVQGSFSTKYRQNAGIAFCLAPAAKRLWPDGDDRRAFWLRHLEYYNGNPFMVPLVLGSLLRMEELYAAGQGITARDIGQFKKVIGPATGSVGDRFFWSALRPTAIIAGILMVLFAHVWGVVVMLAAFNIPMLALRWHWLMRGYRLGTDVVREIHNDRLEESVRHMETVGAVILAFLAVSYLLTPFGEVSIFSAAAILVFTVSYRLLARDVGPSTVLVVSMGFALAAAALIWLLPF